MENIQNLLTSRGSKITTINAAKVIKTGHHASVGCIPTLHLVCPAFKSGPTDQLSSLWYIVVLLTLSRPMSGLYLKSDHDHFFPHIFQSTIH